MSFQPPSGNPPPPPPGGWQQPPPPEGTTASGWAPAGAGGWTGEGPPPPPPKRSRKGLVIGLGIGAAVLLLLLVVGLATVANRVTGGTDLADLRQGECFNTSKALVADKANRVDCAEPHTDEVAAVLTFPADDNAGYPGQDGILEFGKRDCPEPVASFYGSKEPAPTTQIFVFGPNEAAWENGERTVVCSLREESAAKRTGSYLNG